MAKILGVGGVFLRCKNVESYRSWWKDVMGVDITDWGTFEWERKSGARSMLSPFEENTTYFEPSSQRVMINLEVEDVPALIERAKSGGAEIIGKIEPTEYGIFGWFIDPEGYKIELWEAPLATPQ